MIVRVLVEGFLLSWGKLGYTLLASVAGALNPAFIGAVGIALWALSGNMADFLRDLPLWTVVSAALWASSNTWLTALAALSLQRKAIDGEQVYLREWLPNFFRECARLFLPSLGLSVVYALIGAVIAYGGIYWFLSIANPLLRWASLATSALALSCVLLTQAFLLPLWVSNPGIRLGFALKTSLKLTAAEGLPGLIILAADGLFLSLLLTGRIFPFIVYFGVSAMLRLTLYREVLRKYGDQAAPDPASSSGTERSKAAWAELMRRKKGGEG